MLSKIRVRHQNLNKNFKGIFDFMNDFTSFRDAHRFCLFNGISTFSVYLMPNSSFFFSEG